MVRSPVSARISGRLSDLGKIFEIGGRHGGARLIVVLAGVMLCVFALIFGGASPLVLLLPIIGTVCLLLFLGFFYLPALTSGSSALEPPKVPKLIASHLKLFPQFAIPSHLACGFVMTSQESFMDLSREIFTSLSRGQTVHATDRLLLSDVGTDYWHHNGLEYLETNYKAAKRGIKINRYFLALRDEIARYDDVLDCIVRINQMCGIEVHVAAYEDLRINQRREFAVFGDIFSDEVSYDIFGRYIVENRVNFSPERRAELLEIVAGIAHMSTPCDTATDLANSFKEVQAYARSIRLRMQSGSMLPKPSPLLPPPTPAQDG